MNEPFVPVWSHVTPENPVGHEQKNEPTKSKHLALFLHGFDKHSLISNCI